MAANMNERDCVHTVFFVVLAICASWHVVAAVTTQTTTYTTTAISNGSTTNNSTNSTITTPMTTTTTVRTTTTTIPTTTTIAPLQPPTAINSNSLIGQCPCDLTGNACDINCCCDEDCTAADRKTFSGCLPFATDVDDKRCFRKEIVLFENSDPIISRITDDGLFCVFFDNKAERNYYTNPDLVKAQSTFDEYRREFPTFSFQSHPVTTVNLSAPFYKVGDPIYTVSRSEAVGMLGLPRPLTTSDCVDGNPAGYLLDESYSCTRRMALNACSNTPAVNAHNYFDGFRVVKTPKMFQEFNLTVGAGGVFSLFNNTNTVEITTSPSLISCYDSATGLTGLCGYSSPPPGPSLVGNGSVCKDVVREVHYTVRTATGTDGIASVTVGFVLQNITNAGTVFVQTFSTSFEATGVAQSFKRSGKPGYVVGQPVLAGTLNQTTLPNTVVDTILINSNRDRYMTVVRPSVSGDCDSNTKRASVVFGQEYRTGCRLSVSAGNLTAYCTLMQQKIINTVEFDSVPEITSTGFRDNNRYVGIYGDSDVSKTGDWVKILYHNRLLPTNPQAGQSSCKLSLGMHIQVLYANIGALVNPQPKIIGVSFNYDSAKLVQIRPTLGGQFSQPIEIASSVTFIDVSKPAVNYKGQPPIFLSKVPYDFFYPFISGATTVRSQVYSVVPSVAVLAMLSQYL